MGQFGHPPHKIIEIAMSLIGNLSINDGDRFFGYGGHEASGESLGQCHPHLVELIEPAVDIEGPIFISADDVIDDIVDEGDPGLVCRDVDFDVFGEVGLRF